jgi:hypothetical protein
METQGCGPTALLLSYKPLRTAAQSTLPDTFVGF